MNWMKRHLIYINMVKASALMLMTCTMFLGSCTSESGTGTPDVTPTPVKVETQHEIQFQVTSASSTETTRAIVNNDADLQANDIVIYSYFHSTNTSYFGDGTVKLKYEEGVWNFKDNSDNTLHFYWPIAGSYYTAPDPDIPATLDFMGYWPAMPIAYITSFGKSGSGIQFSCANLPGSANPDEFLYVCMTEKISTDQTSAPGGKLPLQLQHPFSKISFQVDRAHIGLTLSSVVVSGFKNSGTFTSTANPQWSSLSGSQTFTMSPIDHTYNAGYSSFPDVIGDSYLAVPQTGMLTFTINATWAGWDPTTRVITKNVAFTWEPNTSYTYHLDLDTINFSVSVEAWGTNTDYPLNY